MITESDVASSLDRLNDAFEGRYGAFPIYEGQREVGMLTLDRGGRKIYVTYRGSIDSLFEIFSCLFIWKKELPGLKGKVHAGLYSAYQKTERSFQASLEKVLKQAAVPVEEIEFIVEGYSRGSGLAALTALFLKKAYPANEVNVLTYSTLRLFDREGAATYNEVIGKRHWNFVCQEDLVPRWIGPACCGFRSVGEPIAFSATRGRLYNERVRRQKYTYLMQVPLVSWVIKKIIPAASWEAHMPQTYAESAPNAFSEYASFNRMGKNGVKRDVSAFV